MAPAFGTLLILTKINVYDDDDGEIEKKHLIRYPTICHHPTIYSASSYTHSFCQYEEREMSAVCVPYLSISIT